jgi:hypothetical protein
MLKRSRVADRENPARHGEDKKTVAGGLQAEGVVKSGNWLELGAGGPAMEGEDSFVATTTVLGGAYNGEGGLTAVVGQQKEAGRGGETPGAAHRAAAEEGFGRKADEDLPDDNIVGEATVETPRSFPQGLWHGHRP